MGNLPAQSYNPLLEYPAEQSPHDELPIVLIQVRFTLQPPLLVAHSLTSVKLEKKNQSLQKAPILSRNCYHTSAACEPVAKITIRTVTATEATDCVCTIGQDIASTVVGCTLVDICAGLDSSKS
jgi:hypothetical protein